MNPVGFDPPVVAIVAEDEAPQRQALLDALARAWPQLRIAAACEDGAEALEAVRTLRPQLAFLDIRMPAVGGLDVAREAIAGGALVVFTTAYDEYALRAFEAGAADYLLKPVQEPRLRQALERVRERLRQARPDDWRARLDALEAQLRPQGERLIRWIGASVGDSVRMIGIDEVVYFQAQEKYVRVVTGDGEALVRTPVKELLAGLDPVQFWQVHRGLVVRVAAIDRVRRNELGRYELSLKARAEILPVSSAFASRFRGM